jgi:transcription antitermination factor NusG
MITSLTTKHLRAADPTQAEVRWYACYTRGRHEKQVDRLLQERGFESFLPLVQRTQQWKDRKKLVSMVLFPSYVFARFSLTQLHGLFSISGLCAVVRNNGRPVAVADEEIQNVRRFAAALETGEYDAQLVSLPRVGDLVRVVAGPFQGVHGLVIERRKRCRILVGLEAIGWGIQVEVAASALATVRSSETG